MWVERVVTVSEEVFVCTISKVGQLILSIMSYHVGRIHITYLCQLTTKFLYRSVFVFILGKQEITLRLLSGSSVNIVTSRVDVNFLVLLFSFDQVHEKMVMIFLMSNFFKFLY